MKYLFTTACITACLCAQSLSAQSAFKTQKDSVTKDGYKLVFVNRDAGFAVNGIEVKQRMIDAFFAVYPAEAKVFNHNASKNVNFLIDPDYQGVAATFTSNFNGVKVDTVHFNPAWMLRKPTDIDVVTHEVMHIVQEYGYDAGPVWLTEGIADYARYKFGVDNVGAGWSMPDYKPGQSYENSYRITARFFVWLEKNKTPRLVQKLDAALRAHTYDINTWNKLTGESLDDLWKDYAANPAAI